MTSTPLEEFELLKDSKYRMYVAAVDKALKNFDYTSEWADLISALGKLYKVISNYTKFPVIPRRIKISKRLSQCMHPALPSGVHLKALEMYDIIFRCMGTSRLAQELFIYSAGLFPLLGHAAMNIRPALLTIYETHFVPLGERLRPALNGFLSGVLLGMETGSDHFDRTNELLENICEGVGSEYFYSCMWQCVANNSSVRLAAISFVLAHYKKKHPMEDQLYLLGHDIDLVISGLCAAVQDFSVLVQRSALDLLIACFPMNNKQLLYADMVRLVTDALSTILRRDMSLNRRLFSWLLNTESHNTALALIKSNENNNNASQTIAYDLLNDAIKIILKESSLRPTADTVIKPYRLLISLFDKPQIGPVILDSILFDVFRALYLSCLNKQKQSSGPIRCVSFNGSIDSLKQTDVLSENFVTKNCLDLIKNANLLFNTLQTYYIWSYIEKLYSDCLNNIKNFKMRDKCQVNEIGSGCPHVLEICIITDFLLDRIPIESFGTNTSEILPNLFNKIIQTLTKHIEVMNALEINESLKLCTKILSKIQPIPIIGNKKVAMQPLDEVVVEKVVESSATVEFNNETNDDNKVSLEKSKSDSKINENLNNYNKDLLTTDDETTKRERSNSNQMLKKKEKSSPKIEKKSKNKKSKSSSKLYDMKKEDDFPLEGIEIEKTDIENEKITIKITQIENKYFLTCLQEYTKFYVTFISTKILPDVNIDSFFKTLQCDRQERTKKLQKLLEDCLNSENITDFSPINLYDVFSSPKLKCVASSTSLANIYNEYDSAMSTSNNILLEFSAFPNLIDVFEDTKLKESLPKWLISMIVAAVCKQSSKEIQLTSMNTLLEIFSLAKNEVNSSKIDNNVVINGILGQKHVDFVEEHTIIIEEMSRILWQHLGNTNNQSHILQSVTLLYQIHNIFFDKLFVDNIIGKYLSSENLTLDYIKRFFLLWHLGRDLNIKLPANKTNIRNFDRCLLKILDNLQYNEKANLKLLSETFLTHCLLHNDIPRILNPMLTKLLAHNTARVAIRHVNIQDSDCQSEGTTQNDLETTVSQPKIVYAVSNINGNIMYHMTDGPSSPKPQKKKWFTFTRTSKKFEPSVVNMTTSVNEDSMIVTKKNRDFKVNLSPKLEKLAKGNVKLFINPLSNKEIYPDGIDGSYSKINNPTPEGSSSSGSSTTGSNDNTPTNGSPVKTNYYQTDEQSNHDSGYDSLMRSRTTDLTSINSNLGPRSADVTSLNYRSADLASLNDTSRKLLEQIEPIEDGIKSDKQQDFVLIPKSQSFDENSHHTKIGNELSLVHSWSYCISDSDNLNAELELSTTAEDFFKDGTEKSIIKDILDDIILKVCHSLDEYTPNRPHDLDLKPRLNSSQPTSKNTVLYPIHSHICLYYDVFDSNQVFYALQTLKNCILSNSQLFIKCLATSGIKNMKNSDVLYLLARHRKSFLGFCFNGDLGTEYLNFYRGYMFLDVIVLICLNYARTFYPCLDDLHLTSEEVDNNFRIQLESLEILDIIIKTLTTLVKENSKGFSSYIADMLVKCKFQNILLHSLLTCVRDFDEDMTFAEEVLFFNNFNLYDTSSNIGEHVEAFQIQILRLIHSLIVLEYNVFTCPPNGKNTTIGDATPSTGPEINPTVLIPSQQIFLSAVMSALRHKNMKSLQEKWLNMITCCLPYFGDNLKQISISVVHQICNNIEDIALFYNNAEVGDEFSPDYAVSQLESLTVICHYCLLDSSQTYLTINQTGANINQSTTPPITAPSELINNLFNVFFSPLVDGTTPQKQTDQYQAARKTILSHMPRIITSVAKLWQTVVDKESVDSVYGHSKVVKQQLLEFLSPIAVHHSGSFIAAVAVAWYERRNVFSSVKTVIPEANSGQNNLVYLISAIRVIPLDNLVQTVTSVIKNPPATEGLSADINLEVAILELFYWYMRNSSVQQLHEAWNSLLILFKEVLSLSPPAQFLLVAVLFEIMIKCCPLDERKDQKDLQDVTSKLIESVSQICGSCLEQTTWLRRNLAVKEQEEQNPTEILTSTHSDVLTGGGHSVQAQLVLADYLSLILDICFGSSEKDKVNTILTSLMYNIVPYLKTHTVKNMPSFQACSKLLASLSSYQYTRKAWKKDVFDLLFDNAFFQIDHICLKHWKSVVDNLMTYDTATFRELMNRVSMTQSGSLSLFTSREQEYEQKSQLLKRLAYVIYCSDVDQYAKYMPDIQEQLTSSLRLNATNVQAQVFLCFRVILVRMSSIHVTSLWPIIITEMLQVLLQIETELSNDSEEFRTNNSAHIKLLATLDASWAQNTNNGLQAFGNPNWLKLQLATAKLLDLALLLPAITLPQFQMYRWAFVTDDLGRSSKNSPTSTFTPHVVRIAEQMDLRFPDSQIETLPMKPNELLLTMPTITQLKQLHSFFKTLSLCSNRHRTECSRAVTSEYPTRETDKKLGNILERIDKVLEIDFLDKIPR